MIKIVALNDEDIDEAEEEEVVVTKEAQETIAESEYVRAIKLKSDGMIDLCLDLLKELLQTQVLNEGSAMDNILYRITVALSLVGIGGMGKLFFDLSVPKTD